jgi:hypothetical protein
VSFSDCTIISITMAPWIRKKRGLESTAEGGSSDIPSLKRFRFEVVTDKEQQQQQMKDAAYFSPFGTNNRIVKTCALTDGKSFSMTFAEGSLKAAIVQNTGTEALMVNGEAAMTMLEFYQKISSCNRTKTSCAFRISDDSAISCASTSTKAKSQPKLLLNLDYHAVGDGGTAFGMKVAVPECSPNSGEKSVILSSADLDKMARSHKYMLEHATLLQDHVECYNIMQDQIIRVMRGMSHASYSMVCSLVSRIATLDLKKSIMAGFVEECNKRNITCNINRYALYSFCMAQPDYLAQRWQDQERREEEAVLEERKTKIKMEKLDEEVRVVSEGDALS